MTLALTVWVGSLISSLALHKNMYLSLYTDCCLLGVHFVTKSKVKFMHISKWTEHNRKGQY
jgi:hypothetical protein